MDSQNQTKKVNLNQTETIGKGEQIIQDAEEENQINSHNTNGAYTTNIGMPVQNAEDTNMHSHVQSLDLNDQIPAGKSRVILNEVLESQLKSNKDRQQNHPDYLIEQKKQNVGLK